MEAKLHFLMHCTKHAEICTKQERFCLISCLFVIRRSSCILWETEERLLPTAEHLNCHWLNTEQIFASFFLISHAFVIIAVADIFAAVDFSFNCFT